MFKQVSEPCQACDEELMVEASGEPLAPKEVPASARYVVLLYQGCRCS